MKPYILLFVFLSGCIEQLPNTNMVPIMVVEVKPLTLYQKVQGQMIEASFDDEEDQEPYVKTWLTGDELQKVLTERKKNELPSECQCEENDPLCGCL